MATTILLTRDEETNRELVEFLNTKGFCALSWPTLRYDRHMLRTKDFSRFDWIVFTSPHSAQFFCEQAKNLPKGISFAAIGQRTAHVLENFGYQVSVIAKQSSAAGFAKEDIFQDAKGLKIFLPLAEDAQEEFSRILADRHEITTEVLYRKIPHPHTDKEKKTLEKKTIDWVSFFSPSAVKFFLKDFDKGFFEDKKVAAIGPTTAASLRERGIIVDAVAEEPTVVALVKIMDPLKNTKFGTKGVGG